MIPEESLSSELVFSSFILPDKEPTLLTSKEWGGVALNDASQGLKVKIWDAYTVAGDLIDSVYVQAVDVPASLVFQDVAITQISLAFDQNMQPTVAYVSENVTKLYWYDSLVEDFVVTIFDDAHISPRVTLDDNRQLELATDDIIFAYIRDGNLYYRQQRDRYEDEILLKADINLEIISPFIDCIGMTLGYRLMFKIRGNFYGG